MVTVLDLFCGAGGFSYGFQQSGYEIVCGIDNNQSAIDTFNIHHKNKGICVDIRETCPDKLNLTSVDVVIGGPPCQGFSNAGQRNPNDPRNTLFKEYIRFLRYYKPKVFLFENVQGILSAKTYTKESVVTILLNELEESGYRVVYKLLNMADYGVPQKRKRVIFFGIRTDLQIIPSFPTPTHTKHIPVQSVLLPVDDTKLYLSEKALEGIERRRQMNKNKGNGFGAQILKLNEPSYTIPARYYKDGYDALVPCPDGLLRRLSVRELARIQGFPDIFTFKGNRQQQIIQIGNAVPPLFAQQLAKHVYNLVFTN